MNDPHVVSLTYRLIQGDEVRYRDPPALKFHRGGFRGVLDGDVLTLEPDGYFSSVESARELAEPFLRGWELDAHMNAGRPALSFEFETGEVIDRDPPPPGSPQVIHAKSVAMSVTVARASILVTRSSYPEPPASFDYTLDVEVMWNRLEEYRAGRRTLLPMAYYCLTRIEKTVAEGRNRRGRAASRWNVGKAVLDQLGRLTAIHGDDKTARKATASNPLTEQEERWIVACLEALIRRVGDPSPATSTQLTLADLPPL